VRHAPRGAHPPPHPGGRPDRPGAVRSGDEPPTARDPTGSSSRCRTARERCWLAGVAGPV